MSTSEETKDTSRKTVAVDQGLQRAVQTAANQLGMDFNVLGNRLIRQGLSQLRKPEDVELFNTPTDRPAVKQTDVS